MIYTEDEIGEVIDFFNKEISGLNVIGLSGNLGAGKTTFTKHLLKSLGVTQNVVSPTFVLRRDYVSPPPAPPHKGGEEVPDYLTGNLKNINNLKNRALELRKEMTKPELYLWNFLRDNQLGSKFRRQHVVDNFIVDFINLENKLIIELDGEVHDFQKDRDEERTKIFENMGFKVIRFSNEKVINDISSVISKIREVLAPSPVERAGARMIIHIDAYRLENPDQIYQVISKEELADKDNLILIEWPEKVDEKLFDKIFLFEHVDENTRKVNIKQ